MKTMQTVYAHKPGRLETILSLAILAVLIIVAGGIYRRQFDFNPAVMALRPESQPSTPADGTLIEAVVDTTGTDIIPFSPPERFDRHTLYEKINGRADLYLSSGFASLVAQRFTLTGATGNWIEVFVYDMQTPENAFSVYGLQRRETAIADAHLANAYRTENALFMVQGQFYLELIGTAAEGVLDGAMGTLARRFVDAHGGEAPAAAPGAGLFPARGLDADTRQFITANAFGYEALDRIHVAEYLLDGSRLTVFVSDREQPAAAARLADRYRKTLVSYGAAVVAPPSSVPGATVLTVFDTVEIVFNRGRYLAGIHEAPDATTAMILARRLAEHLERLAAK